MLVIQNEAIVDHLRSSYGRDDVKQLRAFLDRNGTFCFRRFDNGLYPATSSAADDDASGYQNAWVRDNVHIAHAHFVWGDRVAAAHTLHALLRFFQGQRRRMLRVIQRPCLAADPMNRPHVRFNAKSIQEIARKWPHAQNDALGYFIWFFCKLAKEGVVQIREDDLQTVTDLILYLKAIAYWQDQDSGHWEETRKISASSIGTVIAGLHEFTELCASRNLYALSPLKSKSIDDHCLADMVSNGESALYRILPYESRNAGEVINRRYDAALLFLIYPLEVLSGETAAQILKDVTTVLAGQIGIRRYLLDSYWCADYRDLFSSGQLSDDFSESLQARDAHVKPGQEAQWCLFDPIIACIHGVSVSKGQGGNAQRALQSHYLNRALGQLTEEIGGIKRLQCPEAYFLEKGSYVPNNHVPLQWTQANLRLALHWLEMTAEP